MSTVVRKSDPTDLRRSVNTGEYPLSEWLVNPVLPNAARKYWVVDGNSLREMTTAEKDAAVSVWQTEHIADLYHAVTNYGAKFYPPEQLQWILTEHARAKAEARVLRAQYLQPTVDFNDLVSAEYKARKDAILAAKTHDEVFAVSTDFSNLDAQAPAKISVAEARGMAV